MPANATGGLWHCLARETGRLGHLYSPGAQRGPYPWFPYALDCGTFSCWNPADNSFDSAKWDTMERKWFQLLAWADSNNQKPMWIIVPDRPGSWDFTVEMWRSYRRHVPDELRALAVQDGARVSEVRAMNPRVVCVGGTTKWKLETWEKWATEFPKVHVLRVNSPALLWSMSEMGVESCDGTGWNRGDKRQINGLEEFLRANPAPFTGAVAPYLSCRGPLRSGQGVLI